MRSLSLLVVISISWTIACVETGGSGGSGGSSGCNPPPQPIAASLQQKVFGFSCIFSSCHSDDGAKANLIMTSVDKTCAALNGTLSCEYPTMRRTDVMLKKLQCAQALNCNPEFGNVAPDVTCFSAENKNQRMPASSPGPLESCKIDAIKTWIMNGLTGCPPAIDAAVDAAGDGEADGAADATPDSRRSDGPRRDGAN
ncbi:MAG TPA: hypothetical protein VKN99_17410 [Polyangia bacterium]|nr:hypothetical protein [Polyangia bacterium]